MRPRRAIPVVLAALTLAVAVPLAWTGATPLTNACDPFPVDERGELGSETSLWPPGVRCYARASDGTEFEATYVAWYELTLALLAGAGVGLSSAAVLGALMLRRLLLGVAALAGVFLLATVAFFL